MPLPPEEFFLLLLNDIAYSPPPGNQSYDYRNGALGPQGAWADVFWSLPRGVGYRIANSNFITFSEAPYPLGRLKLNQSLQFATPVVNPQPLQWIS